VFFSHCWCERALCSGEGHYSPHQQNKTPPCRWWVFVKGRQIWFVVSFKPCGLGYRGLVIFWGLYMYNEKRFYSPQFSEKASVSIRRLAWALNLSMPKTIDILVNEIAVIFSPSVVCPQCKDTSKCQACGFQQQVAV
jgi:hypothetical protein